MKRSDASVDYSPVMAGGINGMNGHFQFEGRNIWYYRKKVDDRDMYVYLDTRLREKESDDFLRRVETNCGKKEDKQDEHALEGWMFTNYIALHWYYKIYQLLARTDLISKYSPMDVLDFLQEIRKVKIDGVWYQKEAIRW